jgi:hypothetical protein
MRRTSLPLLLTLTLAACGSKTGLRDLRFDAMVSDDAAVIDPVCRPLRVRTRVGVEAPLRAEVDLVTPRTSGFSWSIRQGPGALAGDPARRRRRRRPAHPGRRGHLRHRRDHAHTLATGERLQCGAVVEAEPEDPLCPEYALVEPTVVALPGSTQQFAFERSWSTPRVNNGAAQRDGGAVASDDPADDTAALVWEFESTRAPRGPWRARWRGAVASAVGATPVLVGREGDTPDGPPLPARSSFRVGARPTTAAVLRDRVARDAVGLVPGREPRGLLRATRSWSR